MKHNTTQHNITQHLSCRFHQIAAPSAASSAPPMMYNGLPHPTFVQTTAMAVWPLLHSRNLWKMAYFLRRAPCAALLSLRDTIPSMDNCNGCVRTGGWGENFTRNPPACVWAMQHIFHLACTATLLGVSGWLGHSKNIGERTSRDGDKLQQPYHIYMYRYMFRVELSQEANVHAQMKKKYQRQELKPRPSTLMACSPYHYPTDDLGGKMRNMKKH